MKHPPDELHPGCSPIISVIVRDGNGETEFLVSHDFMDDIINEIIMGWDGKMVDEEWSAVTS